jgi:hypothetical protein
LTILVFALTSLYAPDARLFKERLKRSFALNNEHSLERSHTQIRSLL